MFLPFQGGGEEGDGVKEGVGVEELRRAPGAHSVFEAGGDLLFQVRDDDWENGCHENDEPHRHAEG